MIAFLAAATATQESDASVIATDVKYIRCDTCRALVEALSASVAQTKASKKKATSEEEVSTMVDNSCNSDSAEHGAWMAKIDLIETEDARLELAQQHIDGPCGRECQTIAAACRSVVSDIEEDLGEALYASASARKQDVGALRDRVCKQVCRKPPPKLDQSRQAGPAFRAFTDEERMRREERSGRPRPPGYLSAEELSYRLGLSDAKEADGDDGADSMGFGGFGGGFGGGFSGGFGGGGGVVGQAEDANQHKGEYVGRGEAVDHLEHSAAFDQII